MNFLKLRRPCHFSLRRVCSITYQVFHRMSFVCSVLRTCIRRFCNPASFVHAASWSVLVSDVDEMTYSQNSSCDSNSSNMADVDDSATLQSQVWKQMVSFKRKLLGNSSVLPSSVLEMVTRNSEHVLSQQSNSAEMPDHYSGGPKCLKLEHVSNIIVSDSTVVVISEECKPLLSTSEEHHKSLESLECDILPFGDDLSALFDSDNQRATDTMAASSSGKSNFLTLLYAAYYCLKNQFV